MLGLLFVIPLGDLLSRRKLILTNYVLAACSLLAIGTAQDIRIVWVASLITGATSVMPKGGKTKCINIENGRNGVSY